MTTERERRDAGRAEASAVAMSAPERWARVALYFALFFPINVYYEIALRAWAIGFSLVDPAGRVRRFNVLIRQWGCVLFGLTVHVLRSRLHVVGNVPDGRFVVISNHQSTADIAILFFVLRKLNCKFVAKRALGRFIPAVSCALSKGGAALIARDPSREDLRRLRSMAQGLEAWDGSAVLFVEGMRSRDGRVRPYKAAGARIVARESGLPLLPVAVDGIWVAADLPGFARSMPGAPARVTIGEPIPPERWRDRFDAALEDVRMWTLDAIDRGRVEAGMPWPPDWRPGETDAGAEPVASDAGRQPCTP